MESAQDSGDERAVKSQEKEINSQSSNSRRAHKVSGKGVQKGSIVLNNLKPVR